MMPEQIAKEVCEDYGFKVVVMVTVDKHDALSIAGSDENSNYDNFTTNLLSQVVQAVKKLIGHAGKPTIH
jgi:hypothetical protein